MHLRVRKDVPKKTPLTIIALLEELHFQWVLVSLQTAKLLLGIVTAIKWEFIYPVPLMVYLSFGYLSIYHISGAGLWVQLKNLTLHRCEQVFVSPFQWF